MDFTAQKELLTGERGLATELELGTYVYMLHHKFSATLATKPSSDSMSPITTSTDHGCAAIQHLKAGTVCDVMMVAGSVVASILH